MSGRGQAPRPSTAIEAIAGSAPEAGDSRLSFGPEVSQSDVLAMIRLKAAEYGGRLQQILDTNPYDPEHASRALLDLFKMTFIADFDAANAAGGQPQFETAYQAALKTEAVIAWRAAIGPMANDIFVRQAASQAWRVVQTYLNNKDGRGGTGRKGGIQHQRRTRQ